MTKKTGAAPQSLNTYNNILMISLSLLPLIGVLFPRFLAYAPALIGFLGIVAYRPVFKKAPTFSLSAFGWVFAILVLMFASSFWAVAPDVAQERTAKASFVLIGCAVLYSLVKNLEADALMKFQKFFPWAVLGAGILCAFELFARAPLYSLFHGEQLDEMFNFSKLNRSVVVFVLCSFLALYCAQFVELSKKYDKVIIILITLAMFAVLFKTQSQSAQFGFIIGSLFYLCFPYGRDAPWYLLSFVIVILLFSAPWAAQYLFEYVLPYVKDIAWFERGYAADRMEIWDFIARRSMESPLWGHGVEATRAITDFDTQKLYHGSSEVLHPHNFAMQIWIEFGMLGAAFATVFFADILMRMRTASKMASRIYLPLFMACFAIASTSYGLWQGWWLGTLGLMFSYAHLAAQPLEYSAEVSKSSSASKA